MAPCRRNHQSLPDRQPEGDLAALRISKLEKGRDSLVFSFMADTPLQPELLLASLQRQPEKAAGPQAKLTPDGRLVVTGQLAAERALRHRSARP